jgi:hypothetical protein
MTVIHYILEDYVTSKQSAGTHSNNSVKVRLASLKTKLFLLETFIKDTTDVAPKVSQQ